MNSGIESDNYTAVIARTEERHARAWNELMRLIGKMEDDPACCTNDWAQKISSSAAEVRNCARYVDWYERKARTPEDPFTTDHQARMKQSDNQ